MNISDRKYNFLREESGKWVEARLISAEQRDSIMSGYAISRNVGSVALMLGLLLIGVGIITFIAANWQHITPTMRVMLILAGYFGTVAGAWLCETRGQKAVAGGLMFLSGFILLAGIALMSQIYHIDWNISTMMLIWLAAYLPTVLCVRHISVYAFYEVIAIVYMNWAYMDVESGYRHMRHSESLLGSLVDPWQPTFFMLLLMAMAWMFRKEEKAFERSVKAERSIIRDLFIGGSSRAIFLANFYVLNWFSWMCIINRTGETMLPFVFGILAIGAAISFMGSKLDSNELSLQGLVCVGAAGIALTMPFVWTGDYYYRYNRYYDDIFSATHLYCLVTTVLLGAYLVWLIVKRGGLLSTFIFCALILRWYFDFFYSYMSKSIFLITSGLILIGITWGVNRWRRKRQRPDVAEGGSDNAVR